MLNAIQPNLDKLEIVPARLREVVTNHLKVLPAHRVDLLQKPSLIVGSKLLDVCCILTDQRSDLRLDGRWKCILVALRVGCQKTTHANAAHTPRRIGRGNANDVGLLARRSNNVPKRRGTDGIGSNEAKAVVGIILPITKSIDSQGPRILTGGQAHPGRDRDGRNDTLQAAETTVAHQPTKVVKLLVAK